MMKLSSMEMVVNTVDQDWRSPLAETILQRWGFDAGQAYYFRASANFVFVFKQNGQTRFLRFNDVTERDYSLLEAEMAILKYLDEHSVAVALPVKSLQNNDIEVVETELGTFIAVVFEALPGEHLEIENLDQSQFFQWGKLLGQLHNGLKSIPEEYRAIRPNWIDQLKQIRAVLPSDEKSALLELDRILNWAEGVKVGKENFGLIHFDFELDNLKWDQNNIGILDFDDCANYPFIADIAYSLRDLIEEEFEPEHPSFREFLKGYSSETDPDMNLLADLQWFIRLHKLMTFSKLLQAVDIPDSPEYPKWLKDLRQKLVRKLAAYRLGFDLY
jgi:Ser/Thr protein kinase RdoA (MazF antagonist)